MCRANSLVFRENSLNPMSSSIHLQCIVVQFSLTVTVTGTPTYGRRQRRRVPFSRLCTILAQIRAPGPFLTKPGILALLRNRLRLNDVTLSMSSPLVVLRDLPAWFSIFDTAHLTDLCSNNNEKLRCFKKRKYS